MGKREFSTGLIFVACSRVRQLQDLLFTPPFPYQRLLSLANSCHLKDRQQEDKRLLSLQHSPANSPPLILHTHAWILHKPSLFPTFHSTLHSSRPSHHGITCCISDAPAYTLHTHFSTPPTPVPCPPPPPPHAHTHTHAHTHFLHSIYSCVLSTLPCTSLQTTLYSSQPCISDVPSYTHTNTKLFSTAPTHHPYPALVSQASRIFPHARKILRGREERKNTSGISCQVFVSIWNVNCHAIVT